MSREVKFRYVARHTHEGSVRIFTHKLNLHDIEDTIDVIELICSEIDPCTCCFNESQNHCDCDSILDYGEFEVISRDEFTGLIDKNGTEIYDGDIVVNHDFLIQSEFDRLFPEVIEYCTTHGYVPIQQATNYDDYHTPESQWEVIGNIHQHEYLLDNN